nr:NADH dehydrogenase subunit 6 [Epicypta sp. WQY004]
MFQFMLNFLLLIFSLVFSQLSHPLSMGLMLLFQTFLISLLIGLISNTFWFAYILFLVFLGGMLVMFIYVTSLSYNEMFSLPKSIYYIMFLVILIPIYYFIDLNYINNIFNLEMITFSNFNVYLNENIYMINKLYNFSTNLITLFLINYLFLTLIICVKITNFFYGPLRPSF